MNVRFRYSIIPVILLAFLAWSIPLYAQVYDHGDPTAEEQYELEIINRARANPHAEGDLLFNTTDPYLINNRTQWGTPTAAQVKTDFYSYSVKPPLAFNKDLIAAALRHSQDMLDHNYQDHPSPIDGSTPESRMQDAGYNTSIGFSGENIFAYGNDLDEINQEFEYDFGNPGLGHRENLINFQTSGPQYTEIGIGMLHGEGSGGINGASGGQNVGPIITTEDFGSANIFITGVVYGDDNHNNFYDAGEGLAGVTITASNGWSAVSSTSGGYAIPIVGSGTVTLTASGGPLTSAISHTISADNENVKVDFIQGSTGFPDKPVLISPLSDVASDTVIFSWSAVTGEKKYYLQVSTNANFSTLILSDSSMTGTTRKYPSLVNGTKYYWRVQAKNVVGWGPFSATASFTVVLPSVGLALISPANGMNVGSGDVLLKWNKGTGLVSLYWVEVSTSKTFTNTLISDSSSGNTSFPLSAADVPLTPGTTYYWRVRYENEKGWSTPSATWSFITGASSVAYSSASPFQSMVFPNPTSGAASIRFTLGTTSDVSLKIFNLSGIEETNVNLGTLAPDKYEFFWNGKGVPAGIYQYELTAGNERETGRIVIVR